MKDRRARVEAQRAALRARLARRKAAALAALERRRAGLKKEDPRKRRRWWPIVLAMLLLLLLHDCRCDEDFVPPPLDAPTPVEGGGGGAIVEVPPPDPPGPVSPKRRPSFVAEQPQPLTWITALRLQVAARSPRLAACFIGTARPGALKWTAAVEPGSGRVSDQALEPMLDSDPLTVAQRDCAFEVLAEPVYRLEVGEERATPARVGLVIEF